MFLGPFGKQVSIIATIIKHMKKYCQTKICDFDKAENGENQF